jgi:hypothetical protein
LSGAILYLAIVAIWAVVLVPRWLRPRSAPPQPVPVPAEDAAPGWRDPASPGQDTAGTWTASIGAPDTEGEHAPGEDAPGEDAVGAPAGDGPQEQEAAPSPVGRRAEVVKARRRMLTALIALTVIAGALAVTGANAYWILIPPVTLLSGYLLLLRKFTQFDAERARAARIRHAGQVWTAQEPTTSQEPVPAAAGPGHEPVPDAAAASSGAEIIDISGRIDDQFYDQYSDAADRAVGD